MNIANFHVFSRRPVVDEIHETAVLGNAQFSLILLNVLYPVGFDLDIRVDNPLLSEGTA